MKGPDPSRFVYFLRRTDGEGPVKIGCSQAPQSRLATMMSWSPYPLQIAAQMPGDGSLELRFHAHLGDAWSHGEWFHATPAVLSVVERIAAGTFDLAALPAKGKRHCGPKKRGYGKWTEGRRLKTRLSRLFYRSGLREPEDVAAAVDAIDQLSGAARDVARARIEAHLKDPTARGVLFDAPWAISEYVAWAKKHGAPPLTISRAAA